VTRLTAALAQGKEEEDKPERCQDGRDHESGRRKFQAMMEIHFHPRGETEQKKEQRYVNQNYTDPLLIVGFHHWVVRNCILDFGSKFKL